MGCKKGKGKWTCCATCGKESWLYNYKISAATCCAVCGKLGQFKAQAGYAKGGQWIADDKDVAAAELEAEGFALRLAKLQDQLGLKDSADLKKVVEASQNGAGAKGQDVSPALGGG